MRGSSTRESDKWQTQMEKIVGNTISRAGENINSAFSKQFWNFICDQNTSK